MTAPFRGPADRDAIVARIAAHDLGSTPEAMRAGFARLVLGAGARAEPAGPGLRVGAGPTPGGLAVVPDGARGAPVVWLHGGGYVFGAPETHLRAAAHLARAAGRPVHLPRYRLAPEHPWPAQREDALAALDAAGPGAVLAGDSAGGHLALVCALARAGGPGAPSALLLFSPNTDRSGRNRSRARLSAVDPMVDDAEDRRLFEMCFGPDFDPADPEASPLLGDLSGLPPTWIEVGLPEVLHDDAVLLQHRAATQGAAVDLHVTPGLLHMGQVWAPWWDEARASLERAAAALPAP